VLEQVPAARLVACACGNCQPGLRSARRSPGDVVPKHQRFGVSDAGERPSKTSQLQARVKMG
jgi:hypothetical protein